MVNIDLVSVFSVGTRASLVTTRHYYNQNTEEVWNKVFAAYDRYAINREAPGWVYEQVGTAPVEVKTFGNDVLLTIGSYLWEYKFSVETCVDKEVYAQNIDTVWTNMLDAFNKNLDRIIAGEEVKSVSLVNAHLKEYSR
jgi:hypothetical protein